MMRSLIVVAGMLSMGLMGCEGERLAPPPDAALPELVVGSYNAGLAIGFVNYAEARAPATLDALSAEQFDILCAQEIWEPRHLDALISSVADQMPHSWSQAPDPGVCPPACTAMDLDPLVECMDAECPDVAPENVIGCGVDNCGPQVNALGGDCLNCISGEGGTATVDEIVATCGPDGEPAACFAYGGSFGTVLLSRHQVLAEDAIVLDSNLNRRGVLFNRLRTEIGDVNVFCTHLSPVFSSLPHPDGPMSGGWRAEQAAQIDRMRQWVDQRSNGGPVIMLGDFNTGPAVEGRAVAEVPENYAVLSDGFGVPYVDGPNADCTFCTSNPLAGSDAPDHEGAGVIDHVLVRGLDAFEIEVERILDGRIEIEVDGETLETAYSDHYGLRAILRTPTAP